MSSQSATPTLHASLQFIIRTQQIWPRLRVAWREAVPVDGIDLGHEVRYHEATNTLLIERYGVIRTVLKLEWEGEAKREAVERAAQRGGPA